MALPMVLVFLGLVLCGNGVQSQVSRPDAPGIVLHVAQGAYAYAAQIARALLAEEAQKNRIPDQNGSKSLIIGDVNYNVTNVQVTNLVQPSSNVTLSPGTITLRLTNASISVTGNWKYGYKWLFIESKDSGSFKGTVNNASITLSMRFGLDASGHPTISTTGCNRSISNVTLELKGGSSWKNSLFLRSVESSIHDQLQTKLCDVATTFVNVKANDMLRSFPLQKTVANDYTFDNRLLSAPEIQTSFVETKHKATVYYNGDATEPPILQASPLPTTTSDNKMLTILISDYVPNTFLYAMYRRNILRYNLTPRNLPDGFSSCLSTSCSGPCCVGNAFPKLSSQYPNTSVEVELVAYKAPTTTISSGGIVVTFSGIATFRARLQPDSLVEFLTINVTLNAFVAVTLNSTVLKSNVTKIVPSVAILKSAVGSISADDITKTIELLGKTIVIPQLNQKCRDGIPLPLPLNFKFKDVAMEMQNHCLRIATNVELKP